MRDQIRALVRAGLFADNLDLIAEYADQFIPAMPAIYFPLGWMARALASRHQRQALTTAAYNALNNALQQPILDLLDAEAAPADILLGHLNAVLRAYDGVVSDPTF